MRPKDWTPAIRSYAAANNIELVPTPTYASYLNRIEATFGAIDEFVCANADYLDRDAFGLALAEHVRHRNSPAKRERPSWKPCVGASVAPPRPLEPSRSPPKP